MTIVFSHENHNSSYNFEENKGQWNKEILFKNSFEGGNMWIMQHKFVYHFQDFSALKEAHQQQSNKSSNKKNYQSSILHVQFLNSQTIKNIDKEGKSENYNNYFIGNKKEKWASNVRKYKQLILKDLYEGIHLKLFHSQGKLKYEMLVSPHQSTQQIQLEYNGYEQIKLLKNGNLQIKTKVGELIEEKPFAYQIINGHKIEVPCSYSLNKNILSFNIATYNSDYELIIDPELIFATYNGAFSDNFGMTATYGYDGTAYTAGMVFGNQFPIPDSNTLDIMSNFTVPNAGFGRTDVFINKYSPDGTQMLWSTFLGGGNDFSGTETAHSLICDHDNNIYIYGVTSSPDFPVSINAFDNTFNGGVPYNLSGNGVDLDAGSDIYITKISADGHNLLGSTFIGGTQNDGVNISSAINYGDQFRGEIMLDSINNILVASCTFSSDFPILNAIQTTNLGNQEGVLFKITNDFSNLIFSTYIGGSGNDALYSVKIDSSYNMVFAGGSSSTDINPVYFTNGFQSSNQGGIDGIIGKLSPDGLSSLQMTYLGYADYDQIYFVEINSDDEVFVVGQTLGGFFQVVNANYSVPNSSQFIAKLDAQLSDVVQGTVFGNGNSFNVNISPCAFLVDVCGNIYVSGWGDNISNLETTSDAPYPNPIGSADFYLIVLQGTFNNLLYATYLGGPLTWDHVDGGTSRYDKNGVVYQSVCAGCGGQSDFPVTPGAWSSTNNSSNCNNLVYKFDFKLVGNSSFEIADTTGCLPFTVTFDNNSSNAHTFEWNFGDGTSSTTEINPTITYNQTGHYVVSLAIQDTVCLINDTMVTNIYVEDLTIDFPNDTILCTPSTLQFHPNSNGLADEFIWSNFPNYSVLLNSSPTDSSLVIFAEQDRILYFKANNIACNYEDTLELKVMSSDLQLNDSLSVCGNDTVFIQASSTGSYPFSYQWSPQNLIYQQINDSTLLSIPQSASYLYVNIVSTNNCTFSDSIWIGYNPNNVVLNELNDSTFCTPQNLLLFMNSLGSAENFIWSSNSVFSDTLNQLVTDSTYTFFADSIYTLYAKAYSQECFDIDSIHIYVLSSQIELVSTSPNCSNEAIQVELSNSSMFPTNYTWHPDEMIQQQINTTTVLSQPDSSGYLYVEVGLQGVCNYSDSIWIPVSNINPLNVNAFASDTIVLAGSEVQLWGEPNGNYNYTWTPQINLSSPTSIQTNATVNQTTTYYLQINDGICTVYDTITIFCYTNDCKQPQIFVPNAFSPNKKGKNEVLYVRGPNIHQMLFRIYNRWGELVFESTDPNVGWDGSFKGKDLDPDVFDYYLEVSCIGGNKELIKGNITILK